MSAQHTPGPWFFQQDPSSFHYQCVVSADEAICKPLNLSSGQRGANARLIAAAPDLLAAMDDLLAFHDHTHPRHQALFEDFQEDCIANEAPAHSGDLLDDIQRNARAAIAKARGQ